MDKIKNEFRELAKEIKLELNDVELNKICHEYEDIVHGLELIKSIDVENIPVTSFVHPIELTNLEFDDIEHHDNQDDVFSNCKTFINSLVGIKDER